MKRGIAYASAAYLLWGVLPVYFKTLQQVGALEILGHRIVWSLAVCTLLLLALGRWQWLSELGRQPRVLLWFATSSALVAANWYVYIWAVNADHVVDASLGYFINPLVNVLIGAAFLHEQLRRTQWLAVGVAALGVAWLTWQGGALPWIGLTLALTFSLYGLLRKTAALGPIEGLTLETLLLTPPAAIYLLWLVHTGQSGFADGDGVTRLLLLAAGPVTAVPLLLFAAGARRIRFSTLGLLQYLGPTLQLLFGVWLYQEPFAERAAGYAMIWLALAVFSVEGLMQGWRWRASA
ncbi:MAG: EamA family transporter RarD [Proteobacteria bacterium]|jgi:chloramphenicol-sensitive protein RarD|nr:EamA family transporter RarD [Pseudomonadota bacterium]